MNPQDGTTDNPSSSFTFAWCPRSEGARIVFVLILASTFFMSRPHFGIYWVAFTFFFLTAIRYGWFCLIRPPHPKTTGRWWQTPGAVAAGFCIFLFIFFRPPKDSAKPSESSKTQVTANNSTPRQPPSLPPPPAGIQQSELAIASQTIYGAWVEEDPIVDDTLSWTGTTFVWGAVTDKPGKLLLVTNVHCLGLKALFDADVASDPEIKSYGLAVKFSTGVAVPVERFGIQEDGVDIAILVIDAQKVRRGTDYTTLLFDDAAAIAPGAEVVAVGSPLGLAGTQTFGHISAIRDDQSGNKKYRILQTDAAINHGNSGGPLFLRRTDIHGRGDRFVCVGVNTARIDEGQNLGFAIETAMVNSKFYWFDATPEALRAQIGQKWFYDLLK